MLYIPDITRKAREAAPAFLAALAAFLTYFCMYGFRKPITAATFDGMTAFGISFKSAIVIAQVLGYMVSKFIGIRFIASLNKKRRSFYIVSLIGSAHLCLLLMAMVPIPFNCLFPFLNGLCLGLIWGLVFSYIEGRRYTDIVALVLSINFIFSSGVVKTIGRYLIINWHVSELQMPFITGLFFLPLLVISVWLLNRIPPPSIIEIAERGERPSLDAGERKELLQHFLPGLAAVGLLNLLLTILRDIKDNYGVEMLRSIRRDTHPALFSQMETIAAILVFLALLSYAHIKDHFQSLRQQHRLIAGGFTCVTLCAAGLAYTRADAIMLVTCYTIGLYIAYNCIQCLFLERFIAATKMRANTGFFFYVMDAIGYMGSCLFILLKEWMNTNADWLNYFISVSMAFGLAGLFTTAFSWKYFNRKLQLNHYNKWNYGESTL